MIDVIETGFGEEVKSAFRSPKARQHAELAVGDYKDAMFALQGNQRYDLIVFAAKEKEPPDQVFLDRVGTGRHRRIRVHHMPLLDAYAFVPTEQFSISISVPMIAEAFRRGSRILVSCNKGINRSAFVAALVLRDVAGISGADALRQVQSRRVRGTPLQNPFYVRVLEQKPARRADGIRIRAAG